MASINLKCVLSKQGLLLLFLLLLFFTHIPFLTVDPDTQVDIHTRGAWTDEGIYASQVLNFLESGTFDLHENSTFVRGPVFGLLELPLFFLTGPHRITARLMVLLLLLLSLWFLAQQGMYTIVFILIPTTLLQYQVFHFSHYAMAEMLCITTIIMALAFFIKAINSPEKRTKYLLWSSFFLFLAYGLKIQYLYVAAALPLATVLLFLFTAKTRDADGIRLNNVLISITLTLAWALLYFICWYLPNAGFYQYIMGSEVSGRYQQEWQFFWQTTRLNIQNLVWKPSAAVLIILFFLALILTPWKRMKGPSLSLLSFLFAWIILELHKFPMTYLPNRYLLSFYVAIGLYSAAIMAIWWMQKHRLKTIILVITLGTLLFNSSYYIRSIKTRTDYLGQVNRYLAGYDLKGETILGPWAASVSWGTHAITKVVWNDYFNYKEPIKAFNPIMVVSEEDEEESGKAYSSQGIELQQIADSSLSFPVWRYQLNLFWIGNE